MKQRAEPSVTLGSGAGDPVSKWLERDGSAARRDARKRPARSPANRPGGTVLVERLVVEPGDRTDGRSAWHQPGWGTAEIPRRRHKPQCEPRDTGACPGCPLKRSRDFGSGRTRASVKGCLTSVNKNPGGIGSVDPPGARVSSPPHPMGGGYPGHRGRTGRPVVGETGFEPVTPCL